jgi:predicted anti-sigma-YlaC factor YlaD
MITRDLWPALASGAASFISGGYYVAGGGYTAQ